MNRTKCAVLFLLVSVGLFGQSTSLPRSTPEAEGVSSQHIISFLDAVSRSNHEFHSVMVLRHGKVVAEGWWNPYRPDLKHTMYSVSKTFTATAGGVAVFEKKEAPDDHGGAFFSHVNPSSISPNLSALLVTTL